MQCIRIRTKRSCMLKMILVLDFNKSNRNVECGKSPCKGTIHNVKLYVDENDDDDNKQQHRWKWRQTALTTSIYSEWTNLIRCHIILKCKRARESTCTLCTPHGYNALAFGCRCTFSKWRKIYWCNFKLIVCSCIHLFIFICTLPVYCINNFHFVVFFIHSLCFSFYVSFGLVLFFRLELLFFWTGLAIFLDGKFLAHFVEENVWILILGIFLHQKKCFGHIDNTCNSSDDLNKFSTLYICTIPKHCFDSFQLMVRFQNKGSQMRQLNRFPVK